MVVTCDAVNTCWIIPFPLLGRCDCIRAKQNLCRFSSLLYKATSHQSRWNKRNRCFVIIAKNEEPQADSRFSRWSTYTRFNKSDDEKLLYLRDEQHKTWSDISAELGRSISSCLSRYYALLVYIILTSRTAAPFRYQLLKSKEPIDLHFSTEEDLSLKQMVEQGKSWVEIARILKKPYPHVCKRRLVSRKKSR